MQFSGAIPRVLFLCTAVLIIIITQERHVSIFCEEKCLWVLVGPAPEVVDLEPVTSISEKFEGDICNTKDMMKSKQHRKLSGHVAQFINANSLTGQTANILP